MSGEFSADVCQDDPRDFRRQSPPVYLKSPAEEAANLRRDQQELTLQGEAKASGTAVEGRLLLTYATNRLLSVLFFRRFEPYL